MTLKPKRLLQARLPARAGASAPSVRKHSQLASFRARPDTPLELPSENQMMGIEDVTKLVRSAKEMRSYSSKQDRKSQHRELAMVYHAALFLKNHCELWKSFCEHAEIPRIKCSPAAILRAVLREYTGSDKSGIKSASRYYRAFISHFDKGTPSNKIYNQLTSQGGVDAFLRTRNTALTGSDVPSSKERRAPFRVDHEGEFRASLQGNSVRSVVLAVRKPGHWQFRLIATKALNARHVEWHEIEPDEEE